MSGNLSRKRPPPDLLATRAAKIAIVATIAAFFSIVAFGNITDYGANLEFVRYVLSMETTFQSPNLTWRAIENPVLQTAAYWTIIVWEGITALLCWIGAVRLGMAWESPSDEFLRARTFAIAGLAMGFILYGFGFLVVASEWFAMWQSETWNAQATAGMFTTVILGALIFIGIPETRAGADRD